MDSLSASQKHIMTPADPNLFTREEWRSLGFFYDRDDDSATWTLRGSKKGLKRFAVLLRNYASNPKNQLKSEHEHFGPYMYLKIMTWPEAGVGKAIHGTLDDLKRLADIIDEKLEEICIGESLDISFDYAVSSEYRLALNLFPDNTDPASLDPLINQNDV